MPSLASINLTFTECKHVVLRKRKAYTVFTKRSYGRGRHASIYNQLGQNIREVANLLLFYLDVNISGLPVNSYRSLLTFP